MMPRDSGYPSSRNPQFQRGFVDSVECRLEELGSDRCSRCGGSGNSTMWEPGIGPVKNCFGCNGTGIRFVSSPWAKAVVAALPVTRFVLNDNIRTSLGGGWELYDIPHCFLEHLPATTFSTREAAADALAVAACSLIRGEIQ